MSNYIIQIQIMVELYEDRIKVLDEMIKSIKRKKKRLAWNRDFLIHESYELGGIENMMSKPYLFKHGIEKGYIPKEMDYKDYMRYFK